MTFIKCLKYKQLQSICPRLQYFRYPTIIKSPPIIYQIKKSHFTQETIPKTLTNDTNTESSIVHPQPIPHPLPNVQYLTNDQLHKVFNNWFKLLLIRCSILWLSITFPMLYFWNHEMPIINTSIKSYINHSLSHTTLSILSSSTLNTQITSMTRSVLEELFHDPKIQTQTKQFIIKEVIAQPDFIQACTILLKQLFTNEVIIANTKRLVINVINDDLVIREFRKLIGNVISATETEEAVVKLIHDKILDDTQLQLHVQQVFKDIIGDILNDDSIQMSASEFIQQVVTDEHVMKSSSDALYEVLVTALTPNVFKNRDRNGNEDEDEDIVSTIDSVTGTF